MKLSIFGLGYVGAVTAACFAREGHYVLGVDIDQAKLEMMRNGQSPIVEEGLPDLIRNGVEAGRIEVTNDPLGAVHDTEASLLCVGTPSRQDGSLDITMLSDVVSQIGTALRTKRGSHLVIVRSTILPGTVNKVLIPVLEQASQKNVDHEFDVCFNPEFLREGTSLADFYNPPFTIAGTRTQQAAALIGCLYRNLPAPFLNTTVEAAEMIKCACNAFHALKIVFANEIGNLCKALRIDSHEVMKILCSDTKLNIAPSYLRPGFAFGGSCLPKDLRALDYQARALCQETPVLRAILPSNALQIEKAIRMVLETGRRKVAILGLSFKQGTDDLRESPLVVLAERLLGKGLDLVIYDEKVSLAKLIGANKRFIEKEIPHLSRLMTTSLQEAFSRSEVVVIGNNSPAFSHAVKTFATSEHRILDLVRLDDGAINGSFKYDGISW